MADTVSALWRFILAGVQKLKLFLSYWHVEEDTTVGYLKTVLVV